MYLHLHVLTHFRVCVHPPTLFCMQRRLFSRDTYIVSIYIEVYTTCMKFQQCDRKFCLFLDPKIHAYQRLAGLKCFKLSRLLPTYLGKPSSRRPCINTITQRLKFATAVRASDEVVAFGAMFPSALSQGKVVLGLDFHITRLTLLATTSWMYYLCTYVGPDRCISISI